MNTTTARNRVSGLIRLGLLAVLSLALLSSGCTTGPLPGNNSPDIAGVWDWDVEYDDGTDVQFTMVLDDIGFDEYRARVDGDDVGRVFMDGERFTWVWNRLNGVSRAFGEWDNFGFDEEISGTGYDSFDDTTIRDDFDFVATLR
jgi:hypothetical protein